MADPMDFDSASDLVEELYSAILDRKPDETGLHDKATRLVSKAASLRTIVDEFLRSDEFAKRMPILLRARDHDAERRFTNDVSQFGEIWMLVRMWVNAQARCGVVVDVGARGRERSNSYDLMKHFGWRGLLVEANPALLASIEADFGGLDMHLVSCAVSDYEGRATFTLGANDDVSSLDPAAAAGWGETTGSVEVDVRRLPGLLAAHDVPHEFDLLSLDIEGEDIKVLNDLVENSPYRPSWIIIEASHDFKVRKLEDAPFSPGVRRDYRVRAATRANLILTRIHPGREAWIAACEAGISGDGPDME